MSAPSLSFPVRGDTVTDVCPWGQNAEASAVLSEGPAPESRAVGEVLKLFSADIWLAVWPFQWENQRIPVLPVVS